MANDTFQGIEIYKLIFDHSPEAIVLLDKMGNFIKANGRLYDWIGHDPDEVVGKSIMSMSFLPPKSKAIVAAKFAERMLGKDIPPYDLEFINKDGETKTGRVIGTPIKNPAGEVVGDLVMISEITELKQVENSLKEKVKELEELNKLMIGRELKMAELKEQIKKNK